MALGDLAGEDQADARAAGLGGVEGDEEVAGVAQPGALVLHQEVELAARATPPDLTHAWPPSSSEASTAFRMRLMRACSSWSAVGADGDGAARPDVDGQPGLQGATRRTRAATSTGPSSGWGRRASWA